MCLQGNGRFRSSQISRDGFLEYSQGNKKLLESFGNFASSKYKVIKNN